LNYNDMTREQLINELISKSEFYEKIITQQKQMEEKLLLAKERFSMAFNSNPAAMTISLKSGEFIYANECFLKRRSRKTCSGPPCSRNT